MSAVAWSLVAAFGFGFTQILNRKSNQLAGAFRTAFGLLAVAELVLLAVATVTGEIRRLPTAPIWALGSFAAAAVLHFGGGWTLLALSQQKVGVARTGAVVALAPLVGTLAAGAVLNEPLTSVVLLGVLIGVVGVVLLSLSGAKAQTGGWPKPWHALIVAVLWGTSPLLTRLGLSGFNSPVLGLTVGIGVTALLYGLGLYLARHTLSEFATANRWRALLWMTAGGITGAIAITAQWISFGLTTIALALSVQQIATLLVVVLAPFAFREPFERLNLLLLIGTVAILGGTTLVVLNRA